MIISLLVFFALSLILTCIVSIYLNGYVTVYSIIKYNLDNYVNQGLVILETFKFRPG